MSLFLTGAAGAATGFARTLPMKGRAVGSSGLATKSTTLAEQGFALRLDPTSESEDKQIRFWEQAIGLRDSRRFKRAKRVGEQIFDLRFAVDFSH